jgi:hypothetical protein
MNPKKVKADEIGGDWYWKPLYHSGTCNLYPSLPIVQFGTVEKVH